MSYRDVDLADVTGHRQVIGAYLVGLAGSNGGILATLDRALAARFPEAVELVTDRPQGPARVDESGGSHPA